MFGVFFCGSSRDVYVSTKDRGSMIFSLASEPIVAVGFYNNKLLVVNSAGLLSWFNSQQNIQDKPILPLEVSFEAVAPSGYCFFSLDNLRSTYSGSQIHRILSSICHTLINSPNLSYVTEAECLQPLCAHLNDEEVNFYSPIAASYIYQSLSNITSPKSYLFLLPELPKKAKCSSNVNFSRMHEWLAERIRANVNLRFSDALNAAKVAVAALSCPQSSGGLLSEEKTSLVISAYEDIESNCEKFQKTVTSPDHKELQSLLNDLVSWVENTECNATWRTVIDDDELLRMFDNLKRLILDSNPKVVISVFHAASPRSLESITNLFQIESGRNLRSLIKAFMFSWIELLLEMKVQSSALPVDYLLSEVASESGGGVLLYELLREIVAYDSMDPDYAEKSLSLAVLMVENRYNYEKEMPTPLPTKMEELFKCLCKLAAKHYNLIPLSLQLVEMIVRTAVFMDYFNFGEKFGRMFSVALLELDSYNDMEKFTEAIIQRYIFLSADDYLKIGICKEKPTVDDLILLLSFWGNSISNAELLNRGIVHSSDLNVLVDFCTRQLEIFEIDDSSPKKLEEAFKMARKLFLNTLAREDS